MRYEITVFGIILVFIGYILNRIDQKSAIIFMGVLILIFIISVIFERPKLK